MYLNERITDNNEGVEKFLISHIELNMIILILAPRPPGAAPSGPRAPRPKNNAASSSNAAAAATTRHAVAVNPAEISLGGDAVRWGDLKREEVSKFPIVFERYAVSVKALASKEEVRR